MALSPLMRGLRRLWATLQTPGTPEALVSLGVVVLYPLAISSYFLPMAGESRPAPAGADAAVCLHGARLGGGPSARWLRVAFAVSLVYGVAISFLFVALGVRIYHTFLPFPLTDLYWPLISSGGIVPARNGETPQSLLTLIQGFPSGIAFSVSCRGPRRLDVPRRARARFAQAASPPPARRRAHC